VNPRKLNILNKFKHAFEGIFYLVKKDKNFKIHLFLFLIVVLFGSICEISNLEWITILICSAFVLSLEALNSAVEKLADLVHKEIHPEIKIIKDVCAGAVLISAIFSIAVALIIFIPKILSFFV
jgi:undecaprenol kinase